MWLTRGREKEKDRRKRTNTNDILWELDERGEPYLYDETPSEKIGKNPDLMERVLEVGAFELLDLTRMKRVCTLWRALVDKALSHIDYTQTPTVNALDKKVPFVCSFPHHHGLNYLRYRRG